MHLRLQCVIILKTAVGDGQERQDFDSESFMQEVDIPYW